MNKKKKLTLQPTKRKDKIYLPYVALVLFFVFAGSTLYPYRKNAPVLLHMDFLVPSATVMFGGDMMFDRTIRTTLERKGGDYLFSCIDDTLQASDTVVANLEGPITANMSLSQGSEVGSPGNYTFTFPTTIGNLLHTHHVGFVDLGNNHISNFGEAGVDSTRTTLDTASVSYFGDPFSENVAYAHIHGVDIAFISYNEFGGSAQTTISHIKEARAEGIVPVVFSHWGIEYESTAPQYVVDLAHRFVDAGAALVVGAHPHVVQQHEMYRGIHIYYSLGNFIFDQYFSHDVRHGLLLKVSISKNGVSGIEEISTILTADHRVCRE